MHHVNLPPLVASTELVSCANGLKFKSGAVTVYAMQHFLIMADQDLWFMEQIYG